MHRMSFFLGVCLFICCCFDHNEAIKNHRPGNRREHESLLDKQERERNEKERKKDEEKKDESRNITCYKCDGDLCRDPFQNSDSVPVVQCENSCWKGVFAASVRRGCGNKRCTFTFQGSTAVSNTCCKTSYCNNVSLNSPSVYLLLSSMMIAIKRISNSY